MEQFISTFNTAVIKKRGVLIAYQGPSCKMLARKYTLFYCQATIYRLYICPKRRDVSLSVETSRLFPRSFLPVRDILDNLPPIREEKNRCKDCIVINDIFPIASMVLQVVVREAQARSFGTYLAQMDVDRDKQVVTSVSAPLSVGR